MTGKQEEPSAYTEAALNAALPIKYRPLEATTITSGFSCGEREIDQWFIKDALKEQVRGTILTTCAYLPDIASPAGFYALASVSEEVRNLPDYDYHKFGRGEYFPCLQLVFLAVHTRYQGKGIGTSMVGAVTALFAEIGPKIGLPHLILVPINDEVIPYYRDHLGFECYKKNSRMFLSLQSAIDAVSA